eukprot:COSAG02_NODE_11283_length_1755_cov_1.160024_3_plen_104_part_00
MQVGTNAHADARHKKGRHVHKEEHETTEWLLDPLTEMSAVSEMTATTTSSSPACQPCLPACLSLWTLARDERGEMSTTTSSSIPPSFCLPSLSLLPLLPSLAR